MKLISTHFYVMHKQVVMLQIKINCSIEQKGNLVIFGGIFVNNFLISSILMVYSTLISCQPSSPVKSTDIAKGKEDQCLRSQQLWACQWCLISPLFHSSCKTEVWSLYLLAPISTTSALNFRFEFWSPALLSLTSTQH